MKALDVNIGKCISASDLLVKDRLGVPMALRMAFFLKTGRVFRAPTSPRDEIRTITLAILYSKLQAISYEMEHDQPKWLAKIFYRDEAQAFHRSKYFVDKAISLLEGSMHPVTSLEELTIIERFAGIGKPNAALGDILANLLYQIRYADRTTQDVPGDVPTLLRLAFEDVSDEPAPGVLDERTYAGDTLDDLLEAIHTIAAQLTEYHRPVAVTWLKQAAIHLMAGEIKAWRRCMGVVDPPCMEDLPNDVMWAVMVTAGLKSKDKLDHFFVCEQRLEMFSKKLEEGETVHVGQRVYVRYGFRLFYRDLTGVDRRMTVPRVTALHPDKTGKRLAIVTIRGLYLVGLHPVTGVDHQEPVPVPISGLSAAAKFEAGLGRFEKDQMIDGVGFGQSCVYVTTPVGVVTVGHQWM
ncbi:hypothetical protein J8273_8890 [Carpediemonas membranifera]|uniref:Uncharacterized protein n=1 Tax=Carpediemonas membranifera TaxID=201153 RepID=A0A8J6AZA5_9EUKA|nr:hypothetical protein J8273_8890 [Carpediemonas membranifera]|eukprot:KAG9389597.1 hypothetical protein J8273_8890 [Carpediemonas membranifera]